MRDAALFSPARREVNSLRAETFVGALQNDASLACKNRLLNYHGMYAQMAQRLLFLPTSIQNVCALVHQVAALVSCLDSLVGDIEDSLRAAELWRDTLLVFAGDNGPEGSRPLLGPAGLSGASSHPLRGRKRTVWEGGVRVTAFMHSPNPLRVARAGSGPFDTQGSGSSSIGNDSSSSSGSGSGSSSSGKNASSAFLNSIGDERLGVRGEHMLGNARAFEGLFHFVDWAPTLLAAAADRLSDDPLEDDASRCGSSANNSASSMGSNQSSSSSSSSSCSDSGFSAGRSSDSGRVRDRSFRGGPLGAAGRFSGLPYDGGAMVDPLGQIANGVSAWEALAGRRSSHTSPPHRIEALLQYDPVARCGALRRHNLKLVWNGQFSCV